MCNCRRRRCCCLNNLQNTNQNEIETLCQNVPNMPQDEFNTNCGCGFEEEDSGFPSNPMYGQSYVPYQIMNETFMPCSGLHKGTIFPELVSEYCPRSIYGANPIYHGYKCDKRMHRIM